MKANKIINNNFDSLQNLKLIGTINILLNLKAAKNINKQASKNIIKRNQTIPNEKVS